MCGSRVFHNLHVYILIFQLKIFTEKIGYAKGGKIEIFLNYLIHVLSDCETGISSYHQNNIQRL